MTKEKKIQRGLFFSVLIVVLVFLATSICFAGPGKSKGSSNTNKQSLETSKRGKERAEQRHQMKEEKKIGNEGDDSVDDEDESSGEKLQKETKSRRWWEFNKKSDE